jgi:hypothetical protein
MPIIIGVVVAVIVIIVLIFAISSCSSSNDEVQNIPVTGIDTEQTENQEETQQTTEVAPTEFSLTYEVASGKEAYIEVIVDGTTKEADDVSGQATQTYTSSGTIKFVTSNPENVVVKVNDETQTLEANSKGVASVTYKFEDILNQWYTDHPNVAKPTSSTSSSSSTNNSSATTSSSDTSSTSSSNTSNSSASSQKSSTTSSGSSSNTGSTTATTTTSTSRASN